MCPPHTHTGAGRETETETERNHMKKRTDLELLRFNSAHDGRKAWGNLRIVTSSNLRIVTKKKSRKKEK